MRLAPALMWLETAPQRPRSRPSQDHRPHLRRHLDVQAEE